jgi:hypothetical protein
MLNAGAALVVVAVGLYVAFLVVNTFREMDTRNRVFYFVLVVGAATWWYLASRDNGGEVAGEVAGETTDDELFAVARAEVAARTGFDPGTPIAVFRDGDCSSVTVALGLPPPLLSVDVVLRGADVLDVYVDEVDDALDRDEPDCLTRDSIRFPEAGEPGGRPGG